ncbi:MAG: hypothetical protein KatS3mg131_0604 [Candidatus Tectimicrobiota bacterium]|nr:MAG: hypothetical protein KatS3mg131_0604 [Candidatus Tectomicrobia bacterium]
MRKSTHLRLAGSNEAEGGRRAGLSEADDRLPDYLRQEGLGPQQAVFDVPPEFLQQAKQRLPWGERLFTLQATG